MKKTMFKKVFAGIAAVFTLGLCVPTGFTGTDLKPSFETVAESGSGWTLGADGLLTVSNGAVIENYQFVCNNEIKEVTIGDNCTIGAIAFYGCAALTSVTIGNNCTIAQWAFNSCNNIQKVIYTGSKDSVTVESSGNPEIIYNKDKWTMPSKCPKCSGWAIDYKCALCGYFDKAAAQAEIEKHEAEIEKHEAEIDLIQKLIDENTTNGGNTASTFSDGSVLAVIGGSAFLILCGLAAVIIVKRRKKTQ